MGSVKLDTVCGTNATARNAFEKSGTVESNITGGFENYACFQADRTRLIDLGFRAWLAEAYHVGEQRHLQRRPARFCPMPLYETHLPVASTETSAEFYQEILGLEFAYRDAGRDIVFLWVGTDRRSMLGLWGPMAVYGKFPHRCHLAIAFSLPELLEPARGSIAWVS